MIKGKSSLEETSTMYSPSPVRHANGNEVYQILQEHQLWNTLNQILDYTPATSISMDNNRSHGVKVSLRTCTRMLDQMNKGDISLFQQQQQQNNHCEQTPKSQSESSSLVSTIDTEVNDETEEGSQKSRKSLKRQSSEGQSASSGSNQAPISNKVVPRRKRRRYQRRNSATAAMIMAGGLDMNLGHLEKYSESLEEDKIQ